MISTVFLEEERSGHRDRYIIKKIYYFSFFNLCLLSMLLIRQNYLSNYAWCHMCLTITDLTNDHQQRLPSILGLCIIKCIISNTILLHNYLIHIQTYKNISKHIISILIIIYYYYTYLHKVTRLLNSKNLLNCRILYCIMVAYVVAKL